MTKIVFISFIVVDKIKCFYKLGIYLFIGIVTRLDICYCSKVNELSWPRWRTHGPPPQPGYIFMFALVFYGMCLHVDRGLEINHP